MCIRDRFATAETACPCGSLRRCGIVGTPATPVAPPARSGCNHPRTPSAHTRSLSGYQRHDRANFDSPMELTTYSPDRHLPDEPEMLQPFTLLAGVTLTLGLLNEAGAAQR